MTVSKDIAYWNIECAIRYIGQTPRNTDAEAWMDPFSMNMHFQLNLTSGDYVVAARLRIYKLPQENVTTSDLRISNPFEEDEDDEKKIRISVYYYTKSLKKHRCGYLIRLNRSTKFTPEYFENLENRYFCSKETTDGFHRDAADGRGHSSGAGCQARPEILATDSAKSTWQR